MKAPPETARAASLPGDAARLGTSAGSLGAADCSTTTHDDAITTHGQTSLSEETDSPRRPFDHATAESLELVRQNVPPELLALPNWVASDRTPKPDGKPSKAPLNPHTGGNAKSSDPATWGTFDAAAAFAMRDDRAFGVGVNLKNTEFGGLDLDNVIDPQTGEVRPSALQLVESLQTYTELSPSGTGIRMFLRGRKPAWFPRCQVRDAFGPGTALEVYDGAGGGRYLTCTGNAWHDQPLPIAEAGDLEQLRPFVPQQKEKPSSAPPPRNHSTSNDDDNLQRARWVLDHVFPNPDAFVYGDWLNRMMECASLGADGEALAMEWSRRGAKHNERKEQSRFAGFRGDRTIASLFYAANAERPGWLSEFRRETERSTSSTSSTSTDDPKQDPVQDADDPWHDRFANIDDYWLTTDPGEQRFLVRRPGVLGAPGSGSMPVGCLSMLVGKGGIGKSTVNLDLAIAVATGRPWLGYFEVEPGDGRVAYIAAEERQVDVHRRLWRLTRDLNERQTRSLRERLWVAPMHGRSCDLMAKATATAPPKPTKAWQSLWRRLSDPAIHGPNGWQLIVLGPLARVAGVDMDASNGNATAFAQLLERLTELPGNPTVLFDHHVNAASHQEGQTATPRGPTGLGDACRWWGALQQLKQNGPVELVERKSNLGPMDSRALHIELRNGRPVVAGAAPGAAERQAATEAAQKERIDDMVDQVVEILQELGEVTSKEAVYARLVGKTSAKRAAFDTAIARGRVRVGGTARRPAYSVCSACPPYPPGAGAAPLEPGAHAAPDSKGRPRGERGEGASMGGAA